MRLLFIGTGAIGVPSLRWLIEESGHEMLGVITQPDKPAGRKQEMLASPIKHLAAQHRLLIWQPRKVREQSYEIAALKTDVIIVMAYGQILPQSILDAPRIACLNLHASLLPRHRGAAPIQAAILAGDHATGITVMFMDAGLDTGDILLKKTIPIRRRETGGTLHDRLGLLAPEALHEALELFEEGAVNRVPQNNSLATYARKLEREDGRIDWTASAIEIERKIRAMNPWPVAFTELLFGNSPSKRLKIYSAIVFRKTSGAPGEILRADHNGLLIAAGSGSLLLRDVQLEGKKRMTAADFLRGIDLHHGEIIL
jgi:methionyl-tRNA formyltransferase